MLMKKHLYLIAVGITLLLNNSYAFYDNFSVGIGGHSELSSDVQKEGSADSETEDFSPEIFFKGSMHGSLIFGPDYEIQIGSSIPSSSQDTSVTKWNYWLNFLLGKKVSFIEPQIGFGFYFTRLSVDGSTKTLQNGNNPATVFQTPEGAVVATNNVILTSLNVYPGALTGNDHFFVNIQVNFLNIEDSQERSQNIFLSLNYKLGQL